MSWLDRYRPASFRGVPFFVESSDSAGGRRVQVHEYPFRESSYPEDLGKRPGAFEIEGYLVGTDYDLDRDRLIAALEKQGSGELIHPYRGTLQVTAGPFVVREDSRDGGMCRLRLSFVETGLAVNPTSPTAPVRATARAADDTGAASAAAAAARIRVVRRPEFVAKAVEQSWFASLKAMIALPLQDLEQVRRLVATAGQDVVERIALPITFCTDAIRLVQSIISTASGKVAAVKAYLQLAATIPQSVRGTSDQAQVAIEGSHAVTQMVREAAVAEAARAAAAASWESYEQAMAAREAILDAIEDVSLTASDEVQEFLSELRRQLVGAVPPAAANLPHLDEFTPPGTMPVLVIAYQLYDDRGRAQEIVTRNDIQDPLAVPGGEAIEVLIMQRDELLLAAGGLEVSGWEEVEISRSMEAVAGSFTLKVSDRSGWPIPTQAPVVIYLRPSPTSTGSEGGEQIVTGYIDSIEASISDSEHTVTVKGRDKTADLVDCSWLDDPAYFTGVDLLAIVIAICDPFGVTVVQAVDVGDPFYSFVRQPGESAFEAIERACRLRAVLAIPDGLGRLILTRAKTEPSAADRAAGITEVGAQAHLVEGQNILAASVTLDDSGRFSEYVVRSQTQGSDLSPGSVSFSPEGRASDPLARAGRRLLVIAEGAIDSRKAQRRAEWEATVRLARSQQVSVKVQGWRQGPDGPPWAINQLTQVYAPTIRVDAPILVVSTRMRLSNDGGQTTDLTLCRADAFQPERIPTAEDDLSKGLEQESDAAEEDGG